jgi:hypothetical protein
VKRYCIRTYTRDVGSLPVVFPYHDEDERGAWVRWDDAEALRSRLERLEKAAREFVMDDVRAVPDLFNALRSAVLALDDK